MTKTHINTMITHLKKAGSMVTVTPWMFEEVRGEKVEARYLGLKLDKEWQEICSSKNRWMLKFFLVQKKAFAEVILANTTPFLRVEIYDLESDTKIETILGQLRNQLKKDKVLVQHHNDAVGNLYKNIAAKLIK